MPSEREAYWQDRLTTMETEYEERIEALRCEMDRLKQELLLTHQQAATALKQRDEWHDVAKLLERQAKKETTP